MKKITVFILALSLVLGFCACSKTSQIPSLAEIAENGAEWGGEQIQQVQGCTLADLEKAWGKANGELPGEYAYFWKVDDTTSVNVYYHRNAEIEHITVTDVNDEQQAASGAQDASKLPDGYSLHQISFPVSLAEKTEHNKVIFEIEPFDIQLALPEGWSVGEYATKAEPYLYGGVWSRVAIYDKEENCIGAVGYNIFEPEEAEGGLMAIYNQIALGNDYQFDVKNTYSMVKKSDSGETATVDVYCSPVLFGAPDSEDTPKINRGILSFNSDKAVYVAFEMDNSVPDETITSIANSVEFIN